jgi:hypothetical protein
MRRKDENAGAGGYQTSSSDAQRSLLAKSNRKFNY